MMAQVFSGSYYLPIYFQGVKGATPTLSGVYLLPTLLSQLLSAIGSGVLGKCNRFKNIHGCVCLTFSPIVGKIGYYLPFSVAGSVLIAIGNGLLSTLSPSTSTGKWIGYQIILGVGRGIGLQMVKINCVYLLRPDC